MNQQQLQCFLCVADRLNFTKAAKELYISTPTVTHHIKNLEEELQTTLFIRTSRMVKLTEAGTIFYNDAKEIVSKMELAEKRVQKISQQPVSLIKIGCTSNGELSLLETTLQTLQTKFPHVYPQIIVQDYFTLKNLFNNKQLDCMLATKEMITGMQEVCYKKIKNIKNYAIVSNKSPLHKKTEIAFTDLKEECLITLHPKFIPFQYGNTLQEKITLHSQSHFHIACENDQAGIVLANCGYGVAILPEFCLPKQLDNLNVLCIMDENCDIDYGIAYHPHTKIEPIVYLVTQLQQIV